MAAEMLTNAFRHAAATELTMEVSGTGRGWRARFTNNGSPPEREITEGGGIGSLRRRVERLGGRFEIVSLPAFCLTIELPRLENA